MQNKYYQRFRLFTSGPLWRWYLSHSHKKSLDDLASLKVQPSFRKTAFTAMLCGTSGYNTSVNFIRFIHRNNPQARLIVADRNEYPLNETRSRAQRDFPSMDISYIQCDALKLPLEDASVDYIETDAFLQFFSSGQLPDLLREWARVLKPDGYISTRCFASRTRTGRFYDKLRIRLGNYLNVRFYVHTFDYLASEMNKAGFVFSASPFVLPTLKRFTLVKKKPVTNRYAVIVNSDRLLLPGVFSRFFNSGEHDVSYLFAIDLRPPAKYLAAHFKMFSKKFLLGATAEVLFRKAANLPFIPLRFRKNLHLKNACQSGNVRYRKFKTVNDPELHRLLAMNGINVVLSFCSDIYTEQTLSLPIRFFNFHPGLLPNNKGRFPIFWSILKKEAVGITCHSITSKIDSGPILFQLVLDLKGRMPVEEVMALYIRMFPELVVKAIGCIESGKTIRPNLNLSPYYGPYPRRADISAYKKLLTEKGEKQ